MTKWGRVKNFLLGLIMVLGAGFMVLAPDLAYVIVLCILGLGLLITGIRKMYYFITMARFMVGGKYALLEAVILIDFGVLALSLYNIPSMYILLYLAGVHLFSGAVEILRANEIRSNQSTSYKLKLAHGIVNVLIAILCIVFIKNTAMAVIIYSIGLAYSGIMNFVTAFKRTTFVYVQ